MDQAVADPTEETEPTRSALDVALARRASADGDAEAATYAHNSGPARFEPREK
jgi:hypothetical protein